MEDIRRMSLVKNANPPVENKPNDIIITSEGIAKKTPDEYVDILKESEIKIPNSSESLSSILSVYLSNKIDYNLVREKCEFDVMDTRSVDVSVIVPVFGRENFTETLIKNLKSAMEFYPEKKYSITFIEHSSSGSHRELCRNSVNYIWIKRNNREYFNKCLSMNIGAIFSNEAKYYLFHDLDLLVKKEFFRDLFKNLKRAKSGSALQTFGGRRVVAMNNNMTSKILEKTLDIKDVITGSDGANYCPPGAPGGSIFVSKKGFLEVGGFDAEIFHSYSPEDAFFYEKLSHTIGIDGCNDPLIDSYHMEHPRTNGKDNPDIWEQRNNYERFKNLPDKEKTNFIQFISYNFIKNIS
jgi:hypothetical protein